jgi:hypothetical protein
MHFTRAFAYFGLGSGRRRTAPDSPGHLRTCPDGPGESPKVPGTLLNHLYRYIQYHTLSSPIQSYGGWRLQRIVFVGGGVENTTKLNVLAPRGPFGDA